MLRAVPLLVHADLPVDAAVPCLEAVTRLFLRYAVLCWPANWIQTSLNGISWRDVGHCWLQQRRVYHSTRRPARRQLEHQVQVAVPYHVHRAARYRLCHADRTVRRECARRCRDREPRRRGGRVQLVNDDDASTTTAAGETELYRPAPARLATARSRLGRTSYDPNKRRPCASPAAEHPLVPWRDRTLASADAVADFAPCSVRPVPDGDRFSRVGRARPAPTDPPKSAHSLGGGGGGATGDPSRAPRDEFNSPRAVALSGVCPPRRRRAPPRARHASRTADPASAVHSGSETTQEAKAQERFRRVGEVVPLGQVGSFARQAGAA